MIIIIHTDPLSALSIFILSYHSGLLN